MHFSSSHICAAVKGNEIQSFMAVWMGAEDTVFSEGSQAQKMNDTYIFIMKRPSELISEKLRGQ